MFGRGQPAQALPDLLASVYALCGGAHRVAARHAVDAARQAAVGAEPSPRPALLQVDTLRDHLRRLWLDAPRLVSAEPAPDPAELVTCPLFRRGQADLASSRDWIEQRVLGGPAQAWREAWSSDPDGFASRWCAAGESWPARWLRSVRQDLGGTQQRVRPLLAHGSTTELRRLARQLQDDASFALAPTWRGQTVETGCWTRLHDPATGRADNPCAPLWLRHAARLADIAQLIGPAGEDWLAHGQLSIDSEPAPPGPGQGRLREGLGWCETARGLLLHWVRLDDQDRVSDCRLIAPTEWNFHPFGSAARALSALPPTVDERQLQLLVGAYDPCVAVDRERGPGVDDA